MGSSDKTSVRSSATDLIDMFSTKVAKDLALDFSIKNK
jgi:hypothetical protein